MPILKPYDDAFSDREHPILGQRTYTISQSQRDGVILVSISVLFAIVACVLFYMASQYELLAMYGVLAAFIGLLFAPIGLNKILRSRTTVHIYENGIEKVVGNVRSCVKYEDVTKCKLIFGSRGISTGFGMDLSDNVTTIKIWDSLGRWDLESSNDYTSLANKIASKIPKNVEITGIFCTKNTSG
ncbi:hypothetical protein N9Y42_05905 [Mariniblastus sp.]|nr:hypothetical protein [Mariniblastus sp.]